MTNTFGHYSFGNLPMGSYTVAVDRSTLPPSATTQTADPDATLDDQTVIVLPAGGADDSANFGYQALGSIGDTVYADHNGNGTQDAGEPGLDAVVVSLLDNAGAVISTADNRRFRRLRVHRAPRRHVHRSCRRIDTAGEHHDPDRRSRLDDRWVIDGEVRSRDR